MLGREKFKPYARGEVVNRDQREREKSPEHEGVSDTRKRTLLDHLSLEQYFPYKLFDPPADGMNVVIRLGPRLQDRMDDRREPAPEKE